MSFRNRLTLFFVAIVIVPMVSVAFVLFSLISDNEKGKADAELRAQQPAARNVYRRDVDQGGKLALRIGSDVRLAQALRRGDDDAARTRAGVLLRQLGAVRVRQVAEGRPAAGVKDDGSHWRKLYERGGVRRSTRG